MPVQTYSINTPDRIVGQTYGMAFNHIIQTGILDATADKAAAGIAVLRGATDNEVTVGGAALLHGIIVKQQTKEAATRPADGSVAFAEKDLVGVLRDGFIWVRAVEAVSAGDAVHINADGEFYAAGHTTVTNASYETTASAGEIALVKITK